MLVSWLKNLFMRRKKFNEILWIQAGGEIVLKYEGDYGFVKGDWDEFQKYASRDDLVFYHTHPSGHGYLSDQDKASLRAIRYAVEHDFVFILIYEDAFWRDVPDYKKMRRGRNVFDVKVFIVRRRDDDVYFEEWSGLPLLSGGDVYNSPFDECSNGKGYKIRGDVLIFRPEVFCVIEEISREFF